MITLTKTAAVDLIKTLEKDARWKKLETGIDHLGDEIPRKELLEIAREMRENLSDWLDYYRHG